MAAEAFAAVRQVLEALHRLNVPYAVAGSFASSIYGVHRMTADCDLVADLREADVEPLVALLESDFYADPDMIRDAILHRRSFNLIHVEAVFKIDIFIPKGRPYDRILMERRVEQPIFQQSRVTAWFVSPEDCILSKLEWYRIGHEVSDTQRADVLGVVKVQGDKLDLAYLRRWAAELQLGSLVEAVLLEAGVQ